MMTTPRKTANASRATLTRQGTLQAMLYAYQHEMQTVLQRRLQRVPSGGPGDGLDEPEHAEADTQEHLEFAMIQMKADTLQRVREALSRLDAGVFGCCAECEGEISTERLQAMPFAIRCTTCEASHEQRTASARRLGPV